MGRANNDQLTIRPCTSGLSGELIKVAPSGSRSTTATSPKVLFSSLVTSIRQMMVLLFRL